MKVSLNWLKRYVDIDVTAEELCEKMTSQGFEVEGIEKAAIMTNVVVAKILEIEKHPDSDHLLICQLDIGTGEKHQIVTGADNVFVGAFVPAALDNADLPNGQHIKNGKLRGVKSNGMLCSGEELGLIGTGFPNAEVNGILILDDEFAAGTDMNQVLGADDCVIDFSITSNRPDCNCVLGIAREVAVCLGKNITLPETDYTVKGEATKKIEVKVLDKELCPRYIGCTVENIRIAPSPKWLADCLIAAGMRPINNIVDITNFVMLETGQPMHAFDIDDIADDTIIVRRAEEGENITTLDEKQHVLTDEMLVIADGKRAVGVAGVMGGENSEIKETTKGIFFESAKFKRDSIRKTARALGIRTESSSRYEKGIDNALCRFAMDRALSLIDALGAGEVTSWNPDICDSVPQDRELIAPMDKINKLLGIEVPTEKALEILNNLDIKTELKDGNLVCLIPPRREDIEGVADIAEEIIRVYGYDHIVSQKLSGVLTRGTKTKLQNNCELVKEVMLSLSAHEIATYSFISPDDYARLSMDSADAIKILNPLGEDYSLMRTQMYSSMLSVLATNTAKGNNDMRLFEISKRFIQADGAELPEEKKTLMMGFVGENEDFYSIKAALDKLLDRFNVKGVYARSQEAFMHPGRQACVTVGKKQIALIGEAHPDVAESYGISGRALVAQVDLVELFAIAKMRVSFKMMPKYPSSARDLAVLVDASQEIGPMIDAIYSAGQANVVDVKLFDIYKSEALGEGKMSVAFAITMQNPERTLTFEETQKIFDKIVRSLEYRFGASIRG